MVFLNVFYIFIFFYAKITSSVLWCVFYKSHSSIKINGFYSPIFFGGAMQKAKHYMNAANIKAVIATKCKLGIDDDRGRRSVRGYTKRKVAVM